MAITTRMQVAISVGQVSGNHGQRNLELPLKGIYENLPRQVSAMPCWWGLNCIWHEIFFIRLFERAFKMMKNDVYSIVIALLVAELFKMTCDVTLWIQNDVKSQNMEYLWRLFCIELKFCTVVALTTKFHDISTVTFPWQHNGLQALSIQKDKIGVFSFKKCHLLLLLIQWVWANVNITQLKHKKLC